MHIQEGETTLTTKELLKLFLNHEYLDELSEQEWDTLVEHVATHRYYLTEEVQRRDKEGDVTWHDAIISWYIGVYRPLRRVAMSRRINNAFPDMNKPQRIFALSTHWCYVKEKQPHTSPAYAGITFTAEYGRGMSRVIARILALLLPRRVVQI